MRGTHIKAKKLGNNYTKEQSYLSGKLTHKIGQSSV